MLTIAQFPILYFYALHYPHSYHHEYILFSRRTHPEAMDLELSIPAFDPLPPQYYLRAISDSWVSCEMLLPVSFKHVMLPSRQMPYTDLIDLTPLPTAALQEPKFEQLYEKFPTFNPIQTQLFHVLYHTETPVLLGAPTGSGKTIVAELALLRMKRVDPKAKCVYIAPLKSLARERLKEWRGRLGSSPLNWSVLELSGDTHHDARALNKADVLVCTPEKWDLITRGWRGGKSEEFTESPSSTGKKFIKDVRLLVIDEIHLLGEERGAVLEAIVSRTRFISKFIEQEQQGLVRSVGQSSKFEATRIIGLSTALANPYDLADWIGINVDGHGVDAKRGLYNFRPSVRPIPMEVHIQGFPGRHYCPRMATMNKPCYAAIKEHSPKKPVIIFVASRRQTRLTALDLINYAAGDENPTAFLGCSDAYVESIASTITDASLRHTLSFGVGLHHAGLTSSDRETVERMFLNGDIQVLCATATLAWGVNLPAHLVIVKGTEFFDGKTHRYVDYPVTDVLQMMGRAGRPQFDTSGKAVVMVAEGKKNFYKKFLYEPFPVESCLGARLTENINAEVAIGTINSIVEAVGYLSWTFYARRVKMNPSFYGAKSGSEEDVEDFFFRTVKETIRALAEHGCVRIEDDLEKIEDNCSVTTTVLGLAASNYYLQYHTPMQMREGAREVRNIITRKLEAQAENKAVADGGGDAEKEDPSPIKPNQPRPYFIPTDIEVAAVAHVLYSLSKTHEFDEHPVRHNEEEHNAELSEEVPWGPSTDIPLGRKSGRYRYSHTDEDLMADPHTKCFLLLQANLANVKLPVTDYITDTRSVMDQIPRLLAAMQYVSLDDVGVSGSFDLMCVFAKTRQVVQAKSMPSTNPLEQIKLPRDAVRKLRSKGLTSLRELRAMPSSESIALLRSVCERGKRGNSSANSAAKDLSAIPLASVEEIKCYCEVEKTSGKSVGVLKFDLIVEGEYAKRGGGGNRKGNKDDDGGMVGYMAVLGTHQGRFLLNHKSVSGISLRGSKDSPTKRNVEIKFDWQKANAHGGVEGGFVTLRLLCENVRGMDLEVLVPLR